MSPSGSTPDVRALVRALDALTTQIKRLANHTANPESFALAPSVADDRDTPTTTCDASILGAFDRHLGPCVLRHGHDGPVHRGPEGETWATVVAVANNARTRADQAEELLRIAHATSNESEAERAAAARALSEVQRERDQLAAVLTEVLATFVHKVPGYHIPRVRSGEVDVVTLGQWRSVVQHDVERPWWQQVDTIRAELEEAQAAIGRVREATAYMRSVTRTWDPAADLIDQALVGASPARPDTADRDGIAAEQADESADEQRDVVHTDESAQVSTSQKVDESGADLVEEVARLRAGEEPVDVAGAVDTPGQWIWWWNQATAQERLDIAEAVLRDRATAVACVLENHRKRIGRDPAAQAALERVRAVGADLEYAATGIGVAEPAREAMRDAARRIRTALQAPSYSLSTTAVVPVWQHNPDGTWSLPVGEGVLTVPASTSPGRRAQFLLAHIGLPAADGWTVRPAADPGGHSSNCEATPVAEGTP